MQEPDWLADIDQDNIKSRSLPLDELLQESLYYPASGFDGSPIRRLAGNVFSFVYVDYGMEREALMNALESPGFHGYKLLARRDVAQHELPPRPWRLPPLLPQDGDPWKFRDYTKEPFCVWAVFERSGEMPDSHGPRRFSLLYLCADGVAAFQALYVANAMKPKIVAIIQPGHGFGRNWTDFTDPQQVLARTVLGNPAGRPQALLHGGSGGRDFYRESCWPDYPGLLRFIDKRGGRDIGVFGGAGHRHGCQEVT
jgi:hypothetical protein